MANIEVRLSTGSTTSTNLSEVNKSLGGKMAQSANEGVSFILGQNSMVVNNLWDDISQMDSENRTSDYRCIYIYNNPTGSRKGPSMNLKLALTSNSYAKFQAGKTPLPNTDANIITDESQAPVGIQFEDHTKESPLLLGQLQPGEYQAVWFKRTPTNVSGAGEVREFMDFLLTGST